MRLRLLLLLSLSGCAAMETPPPPRVRASADRQALAFSVVGRWSRPSALAARRLIERYGAPDDIRSSRLTWIRNGPWKRTVVWDYVVEQTIDYPVTPAQAAQLTAFDENLLVDVEAGELSARSDREEANFLSVNLAYDIVRGRRTAREAAAHYVRVLDLTAAGKTSPYRARLLFASSR